MSRFPEGTIQTYSGLAYDFANPDPATVNLRDIAHALSNACRFAGHTKRFYSVAEHCVRVSRILEQQHYSGLIQVAGLLHDAHEAYVWDCPRPFKPLLGAAYEVYAKLADIAIAEAFLNDHGSATFHMQPIKVADNIALVAEARQLMHHGPEEWEYWQDRYKFVPEPPEGTFRPGTVGWSPIDAEQEFFARARELELS